MFWKVFRWLHSFQLAWEVSRCPGKFPMRWKLSRCPGNFPGVLGSFKMVWKVSNWPGKFPDGIGSFQVAWRVPKLPAKFPDRSEIFMDSLSSIRKASFPTSDQLHPEKTFQGYKNFPGRIATLLPLFFRLSAPVSSVLPVDSG